MKKLTKLFKSSSGLPPPRIKCTAIAFCIASLSSFALADENQIDQELNPVVITATRTPQALHETSSSIAVISQESLEETIPATIGEALQEIPNVQVNDLYMPIMSKIEIRGSSNNEITYLIDGVRQDNYTISGNRPNGFFLDPEMVKQVEIKRGGGSSLYGNGGIGGVIAVTTKSASDFLKPGEKFGSLIKAGYNDGNKEWAESAYLFGRQGNFDLLMGYTRRDGGAYRLSDTGKRRTSNYDTEGNSFITKGSYFFSDDNLISLTYNYDEYSYAVGNVATSGDDYRNKQHRITGSWQYNNGLWVDLKTNLQYVTADNHFKNERTGFDDDFESLSGNFQNTSRFEWGVSHALTYGFDASHTKQRGINDIHLADPSRPDSKGIDAGVFIEDDISFNEYISATPTLRWSYYDRQSNLGYPSKSDSRFTPGLTVTLKPNKGLSFYGSVQAGYRPPILDEMYYGMDYQSAGITTIVIPNPDIKPETSVNWEVGTNADVADLLSEGDHLTLKAALFYDKVKNLISAELVGMDWPHTMYFKTVNTPDAVRKGIEFSANYDIANAEFGLSYGLIHAIDKATDERVPGVTPQSIALRAAYKVPAWNAKAWYRLNWQDGGKSNVTDYETREENIHLPSYVTHSLGFNWAPKVQNFADFNVNFAFENIFNKEYQQLNGGYGYGRTFRVNMSARF